MYLLQRKIFHPKRKTSWWTILSSPDKDTIIKELHSCREHPDIVPGLDVKYRMALEETTIEVLDE